MWWYADGVCRLHHSPPVNKVPGSRRFTGVPCDHGAEAGSGGVAERAELHGVAAAALHAWHPLLLSGAHAHVCHCPQRQGVASDVW